MRLRSSLPAQSSPSINSFEGTDWCLALWVPQSLVLPSFVGTEEEEPHSEIQMDPNSQSLTNKQPSAWPGSKYPVLPLVALLFVTPWQQSSVVAQIWLRGGRCRVARALWNMSLTAPSSWRRANIWSKR